MRVICARAPAAPLSGEWGALAGEWQVGEVRECPARLAVRVLAAFPGAFRIEPRAVAADGLGRLSVRG